MIIKRNKKDADFMHPCDANIITNYILASATNWRICMIGKSGMTAKERFNEPNYNSEYDGIESIYASSSADNVSIMETSLIDCFKNNKKCKNIKDGEGSVNDTKATSDEYIVLYSKKYKSTGFINFGFHDYNMRSSEEL